MKLGSFKDLFLVLLSDIYVVENQIVASVPEIVKKVHSEELKTALLDHLNETKMQIARLEKIFKILGEQPQKLTRSQDIKDLFLDTAHFVKDNPASPLLDAAIIASVQKIEHYEIATYGTLKEFACVLESKEIKTILEETLKEEGKADTMLTKLAKGGVFSSGINASATLNA